MLYLPQSVPLLLSSIYNSRLFIFHPSFVDRYKDPRVPYTECIWECWCLASLEAAFRGGVWALPPQDWTKDEVVKLAPKFQEFYSTFSQFVRLRSL